MHPEAVDAVPHLSQLRIQIKSITYFPVSTGKERKGYGDQKSNLASLFWWSLTISTLSALVVLSWVSSIYIFNNPSEKIPYKILSKFDKLEPIEKFPKSAPPQSKIGFRSLRELMETEFSNLSGVYLDYQNKKLLKNYIENYKIKNSIYYVKGDFKITNTKILDNSDLITNGIAIEANSKNFPKTAVIFILPTLQDRNVGANLIGQDLTLGTDVFSSVINVNTTSNKRMTFTVVPIVYGNFNLPNSQTVNMKPPKKLNIEGNWPLDFPQPN